MSCTAAGDWQAALSAFATAIDNQEFVQAFSCLYGDASGGLIVAGTFVWFGVVSMSYIRNNSIGMPVIYTLIFGGAALSQVVAPTLGFVSILVLGAFALIAVLVARRMETP